jgi:eukaryotic translation initiation factor 2C
LWANYFHIVPPKTLVLYRYDIKVTPEAKGKKLTQIGKLLLDCPELEQFRNDVFTDFSKTLLSRSKLAVPNTINIKYRAEMEDEPSERGTTYNVELKFTNTLSVSELLQYLTSADVNAVFSDKQTLIQAFNIFFNHFAKSRDTIATVGSSKSFSLEDIQKMDLGSGLTTIRGFFSSVRAATARILVNVQVTHGVFYTAGDLNQLMSSYLSTHYNDFRALEKFLKLVKVKTTHLPERKNKAGQVIPRIKTIFALATPNDGSKAAHRPRVKRYGAGPKDVEFWLDGDINKSGGKGTSKKETPKGKPGDATSGTGRYISVFNFFKEGE